MPRGNVLSRACRSTLAEASGRWRPGATGAGTPPPSLFAVPVTSRPSRSTAIVVTSAAGAELGAVVASAPAPRRSPSRPRLPVTPCSPATVDIRWTTADADAAAGSQRRSRTSADRRGDVADGGGRRRRRSPPGRLDRACRARMPACSGWPSPTASTSRPPRRARQRLRRRTPPHRVPAARRRDGALRASRWCSRRRRSTPRTARLGGARSGGAPTVTATWARGRPSCSTPGGSPTASTSSLRPPPTAPEGPMPSRCT